MNTFMSILTKLNDLLLSGNTEILLSLVILKGRKKINEFQKDFELSDNCYHEIPNTF